MHIFADKNPIIRSVARFKNNGWPDDLIPCQRPVLIDNTRTAPVAGHADAMMNGMRTDRSLLRGVIV